MKILKSREVTELTGLCRATIYRYILNQQFPRQIILGPRRVGWVEEEVIDWIRLRIQLRDESLVRDSSRRSNKKPAFTQA